MSKVFWYHVKKCAGTSIKCFLQGHYWESDELFLPFIAHDRKYWNGVLNNYRIPLGEYDFKRVFFARKYLYEPGEFEKMFKFAIVRNPYDRMVSLWFYYMKYNQYVRLSVSVLGKNKVSFEIFVRGFLENGFKNPRYRHFSTHSCPAVSDLSDDNKKILVDFVGKMEQFDEAISVIRSRLSGLGSMPILNGTRNDRDYRKYYSKYSRAIVEKLYKNDLEMFGYKF